LIHLLAPGRSFSAAPIFPGCHCRAGPDIYNQRWAGKLFLESANRKSAIYSAIANPQMSWCASPQIANPQIFKINFLLFSYQKCFLGGIFSYLLKGVFRAGNHSKDVLLPNDDNFLLFYLLFEICLHPSVLMRREKIKMLLADIV
jgi:hypothetical protein